MSNNSQVLDGDRETDNKVQASVGASPSGIHGGMDCESNDKIEAGVIGASTVSRGCSGKSPSCESDMDSDSSVSTLDVAAFCESELRCSSFVVFTQLILTFHLAFFSRWFSRWCPAGCPCIVRPSWYNHDEHSRSIY